MSGYRDRLLGRLRAARPVGGGDLLARGERPPVAALPPGSPELAEIFSRELEGVGGEVIALGATAPLQAALGTALEPLRGARAAVDGDPDWGQVGVPVMEVLREAGIEVISGADMSLDTLRSARIGVTIADLAVAETGTVVQIARPYRRRAVSLLAEVHVAFVPRNRIVPGAEDVLARLAEDARRGARDGPPVMPYTVWITGPSRTADIEKVLTVGVHGPGRLVAVLLPEDAVV